MKNLSQNGSQRINVIIVGAGFAGSVVARQLADLGVACKVIDKRPHIGGNAYDCKDNNGVTIHSYGPHIFHTNSERIVRWLSKFTNWRFYEHKVLADVEGQLLPIPINRTTVNKLYGLDLDSKGVEDFFNSVKENRQKIKTSEDVVMSSVGEDLCNKFFRGYTRKQWGLDLAELSAGVAARIPTRVNDDDRYFTDTYQLMPADGYTSLFEKMLDHPLIEVNVGVDYTEVKDVISSDALIYTGPIDEYFNYTYGKLPYRSLSFEHVHHAEQDHFQSVGTVNYPNEHQYTRITEFKHLTGQVVSGTSVVYEYPQNNGDPYYPIPRPENEALFKQYEDLAKQQTGVYFVGRLAQYRYYNMDQVVGAALKVAEQIALDFRLSGFCEPNE